MNITLVSWRQARSGQGDVLVATSIRRIDELPWWGGRHRVRVLQSVRDPDQVLRVTEWTTREAYERARGDLVARRLLREIDALCTGPSVRYFFECLRLYENMARRPSIMTCLLLTCPAEVRAAVLAFIQERSGPLVHAVPGLLYRYLGADLDEPTRLVILHGWDTLETWHGVRREHLLRWEEVTALGAELAWFTGQTRADVRSVTPRHVGPP